MGPPRQTGVIPTNETPETKGPKFAWAERPIPGAPSWIARSPFHAMRPALSAGHSPCVGLVGAVGFDPRIPPSPPRTPSCFRSAQNLTLS
jgi:hypothetical protein